MKKLGYSILLFMSFDCIAQDSSKEIAYEIYYSDTGKIKLNVNKIEYYADTTINAEGYAYHLMHKTDSVRLILASISMTDFSCCRGSEYKILGQGNKKKVLDKWGIEITNGRKWRELNSEDVYFIYYNSTPSYAKYYDEVFNDIKRQLVLAKSKYYCRK